MKIKGTPPVINKVYASYGNTPVIVKQPVPIKDRSRKGRKLDKFV